MGEWGKYWNVLLELRTGVIVLVLDTMALKVDGPGHEAADAHRGKVFNSREARQLGVKLTSPALGCPVPGVHGGVLAIENSVFCQQYLMFPKACAQLTSSTLGVARPERIASLADSLRIGD
jgi:hypothetical protein